MTEFADRKANNYFLLNHSVLNLLYGTSSKQQRTFEESERERERKRESWKKSGNSKELNLETEKSEERRRGATKEEREPEKK